MIQGIEQERCRAAVLGEDRQLPLHAQLRAGIRGGAFEQTAEHAQGPLCILDIRAGQEHFERREPHASGQCVLCQIAFDLAPEALQEVIEVRIAHPLAPFGGVPEFQSQERGRLPRALRALELLRQASSEVAAHGEARRGILDRQAIDTSGLGRARELLQERLQVFELDCSGGPFLVAKQQGALHALLDAGSAVRGRASVLQDARSRRAQALARPGLRTDLRAEDEHREGAVPRQSPCSLFLSEETQLAVVSIEQQQRRRVGARRIEEELKAPSGNSFDLELGTEVANRGVGAIELRYPLTELVRHLPEGLIQAGDLVLPWQRRDPDPQFAPAICAPCPRDVRSVERPARSATRPRRG
jgi:hypothetical protein